MAEPTVFINVRDGSSRLIVDGSLRLLKELWATTQSVEPHSGEINQPTSNSKKDSSHESDFQAELVTAVA